MGRTEFHCRLASQAVMLASSSALLRAMNTLASSSRRVVVAARHPLGEQVPVARWGLGAGGSSQYWAMTFWVSVRPALYFSCWSTSLTEASLGLPLRTVTAGPWSGRNWAAEVRAKGVTLRQCGVANFCWRAPWPRAGRGTHSGCQWSGAQDLVPAVDRRYSRWCRRSRWPGWTRRRGGSPAPPGRRCSRRWPRRRCRCRSRRIAQLGHLLGEDRLAGREQVDQGGVGGEADRLVLVGLGPFGRRAGAGRRPAGCRPPAGHRRPRRRRWRCARSPAPGRPPSAPVAACGSPPGSARSRPRPGCRRLLPAPAGVGPRWPPAQRPR